MRFLIDTVLANKVWDKKVDSQKFKPWDSTIQLNIEIEYKTQIDNFAIHLMS